MTIYKGLCGQCGAQTAFLNISKGYKRHCSRSCAVKSQHQGERGEQRRIENSKQMSSRNKLEWAKINPNIGRPKGSKNLNPFPKTEAVLRRQKLHPPPSWAGKKHSDETRFKMSETRMRLIKENIIPKVSKYHQGRFNPKNPQKYKGDPRQIIFRSSWERRFMVYCDRSPDIIEWSSESVIIKYLSPLDKKIHQYWPDFFIKVKQADGSHKKFIIEVKPKKQCSPPPIAPKRKTKTWVSEVKTWGINSAKWKYATEWCANNDMEFKVLTEDHLSISYK